MEEVDVSRQISREIVKSGPKMYRY